MNIVPMESFYFESDPKNVGGGALGLRFGLLQESDVSTKRLLHVVSHGNASATTMSPVAGSVLTGSTVTFSWGYTGGGGSGPDVAYKFTGKELDKSTGLYFYEARYYDAALGRFISADTIVPDPLYPQELNRYAYSRNNPITLTDPTGRFTIPRHGIITYRIAQEQNIGIFQSLAYALQTAWQDHPGRQGTGLYDTVGHMTRGLLPGSDREAYASPEETYQVALIRAAVELQKDNLPFVLHQAQDSAARGHVVDNMPQIWDGHLTFEHVRTDITFTDQEERVAGERSKLVFEIHREIEQRKLVDFQDIYELLVEREVFGPGPTGFSPLSSQRLAGLLEEDEVGMGNSLKSGLGRFRVGGYGSYNNWVDTYLQNGSGFNGGNETPWYGNPWENDPYWEDYDW